MEKERHLANATHSTDWVNSMVVSSQDEEIRIRLDQGDLNKLPNTHCGRNGSHITVPDAKVFTVLDAKS